MTHLLPETIYAIQHVAFEDLGAWEDVFYQLGYRIRYFEAGIDDLNKALQYEGLTIILGGPIGLNDLESYPFLKQEIDLLKIRLQQKLPTLGICLGAQLIAHCLGATVYAGSQKEIGWSKLDLQNIVNNPLNALEDVNVLHWHGDTFQLPAEAELLASTALYPNQAFRVGNNILALQFHAEIAADHLEKWLIGHTCELKQAQINISHLRLENQQYADCLQQAAEKLITQYLNQLLIPQ